MDAHLDVYLKMRCKFRASQKLLRDSRKCGTESETSLLMYQATMILRTIETDVADIMTDMSEERTEKEIMTFALMHVNLGLVYIDAEDFKAAEEQFMKYLNLVKGKEQQQELVIPVLSTLNHLGLIWTTWNQPAKAKMFLDKAEQIYKDFTSSDNGCKVPIPMEWNFTIEETDSNLSSTEILEGSYTCTLYYLAQVYKALNDHCNSAVYCHMTLSRQLGRNGIAPDLDYIEWALNAATLSQYLLKNNLFSARHHLAAASYVLQQYETILKGKTESNGDSEELAAEWENFKHRRADVARCWAKYGILLMSESRNNLLEDDETEEKSDQSEDADSSKSKLTNDLIFDVLEKEIESIASQVTDKYLLDFDDARPVFLNVQQWLKQAKEYYTLECHASDYISIVQDVSQAYKYLAFFEEHEDRRAKMHKRRIDVLESAVKELNPHYYKAACRQIWLELAETYSDILDIKLDRLESFNNAVTSQAFGKINHLARGSIQNLQLFIGSLEEHDSEPGMKEFPDDVMAPALRSYFYLGILYQKMITHDKKEQLINTENSINAYKFVIDYCDKYPKATEMMKVKLSHCNELVTLLKIKIDKLKLETSN
ncbi:KIF-binding protein [Andrena cerasifolii]|uniref:KIF-binding protein n=1 Tax=Andrena cerasifolii TaxID=2819439 RepID=UPI004037BBB9